MNEPATEVDEETFECLEECYSGDILTKNKCKAVELQGRLWTVVSVQFAGEAESLKLHELVLPVFYSGPTGPYPFDSDGIFYKGQQTKVRGSEYIMSGRTMHVRKVPSGSEKLAAAGPEQLDLFAGDIGEGT